MPLADFHEVREALEGPNNGSSIVADALNTWDEIDRNYLSFDAPFQMEETWWSSMLGIQDGTRLDGTVGTRISVGLAIDILLIGATGGASLGRKFATKGMVELGEDAAQNAALKNIDDLSWEQMVARATCGANSFSADTPVATPYGLIAIATLVKEKIQEVFGYNEETGEVDVFTVTHYHVHDDPVTYDIIVDDDVTDNIPDELIETTPEHPFYVLGEWVDAEDLEVGMPLSTYEGIDLIHSGTVTSIKRIEETQTMYNLTVDTAHTFFVGEGEWLVHNTGGCPTLVRTRNAGTNLISEGFVA